LRKPGVGRLLNLTDGKSWLELLPPLASPASISSPFLTGIPNLLPSYRPTSSQPADLLSHKLADAIADSAQIPNSSSSIPANYGATTPSSFPFKRMGFCSSFAAAKLQKKPSPAPATSSSALKCRMLGVVLNAVDSSAPDYYIPTATTHIPMVIGPQEAADISHAPRKTCVRCAPRGIRR